MKMSKYLPGDSLYKCIQMDPWMYIEICVLKHALWNGLRAYPIAIYACFKVVVRRSKLLYAAIQGSYSNKQQLLVDSSIVYTAS